MATEFDLDQFLRENPPAKKFVPYSHLNRQSDTLTFYFEGDPDYSQRLTDHVTLFLSLETNEMVGCRVKGISGLIDDLPNYISINHGGINLSLLFFAFRGGANEDAMKAINELAREAKEREMTIDPQLLLS